MFAIEPAQMLMVAAHKNDLRAAAACGCQTAFIARPLEYGAKNPVDTLPEAEFTWNATDFIDLARQLAASAA